MFFLKVALVLSAWVSSCHAIPANVDKRQGDKTYTVTCIGKTCTSYPPTTLSIPTSVPTFPGQPTTAKTTTAKTTTAKPTTSPPKTVTVTVTTTKNTVAPTKTTKTTQKPPPTTTGEETGPSSTRCPVPLFYKCGGWDVDKPWAGCTVCEKGAICVVQNEWYSQCVADDGTN